MTAGTGHRRAAEAIAEAVRRHLPRAQVDCCDVLADTPAWFARTYPRLYRSLVQRCAPLWGWGYRLIDRPWVFRFIQPVRRRWNQAMGRRLLRRLREQPPDVLVATHFFPADLFASAKRAGLLRARLVVIITDLFPHRVWFAEPADAFVVGASPTYELCRQRGLAAQRLHLLGIPVSASFSDPLDREEALRALGLQPGRRTVLIAGGGMGVGPIAELVGRLLVMDADRAQGLQLIVVCGDNDQLRRSLERLSQQARMPIRVLGFVETMAQLMRVSDLLITKAGGLTITEALATGLPLIICSVIPGQEQLNAGYVVSQGAAIMALHAPEVLDAIRRLLDQPAALRQMQERARALAFPHAADRIVERLILPLAHETA